MFQQAVRTFCPKFVRNERKSVRKLNARNKTSEFYPPKFFASNVSLNMKSELRKTVDLHALWASGPARTKWIQKISWNIELLQHNEII